MEKSRGRFQSVQETQPQQHVASWSRYSQEAYFMEMVKDLDPVGVVRTIAGLPVSDLNIYLLDGMR